jgi:transposase
MGRPARLTPAHMEAIGRALREEPAAAGLTVGLWDGKALSAFIETEFGIRVGVRQCQRVFRRLRFRLRKPRPLIAHADPDRQAAHKQNSKR